MNQLELALALVLLVALFGSTTGSNVTNSSSSGNSSKSACPEDLKPCVDLWKQRDLCPKLESICQAVKAGNASHQIKEFSDEHCESGDVYCPTRRHCQHKNSTCNLDSAFEYFNSSGTPWGANCSTADQEFCFSSMSCLAKNTTCSMKAIYDWQKADNTSYGPYGQVCAAGQTFCLATMSCVGVNASCAVPYNASAFDNFCPNASKYCGQRGTCIQGLNSTCSPYSALNITNATDPGFGWIQICEIRQSLCKRFAAGLGHCWPKIAHCAKYEEHLNKSSGNQSHPGPSCPNNQTYCNATNKCQLNNETCSAPGSSCPNNQTYCNATNKCQLNNETCSSCPNNQTYCNATNKCQLNNETCSAPGSSCPNNQTYCNATNKCQLNNETCSSCPNNQTYCNATNKCQLNNETCSSCPNNQTYCNATNKCQLNNETCSAPGSSCPNNQTYCNATNKCQLNNETCSSCPNNQTYCNATNKCQLNNETCSSCPNNQTYCNATNKCQLNNETCSAPGPSCPNNQTYCNATNKCQPKNQTCCAVGKYQCESGGCIPFSKPCEEREEVYSCPESSKECKTVATKTTQFCNIRFELCDILVNKNMSDFRSKVSHFNGEVCDGGEDYCPLSNGCHPNGTACNLDTAIASNSTKSPWGDACPANHTFCGQELGCQKTGSACSARALVEWMSAGNTSVGPYGQVCAAGHKFCFGTMGCINSSLSCDYKPTHGENITANQSNLHVFNGICKGGEKHCLYTLHCEDKNKSCNAFPTLNYTGVSDNGTGWESACKISNYRCNRLKYAVDKCYSKVKECNTEKNISKYKCAHDHHYCQISHTCIKKDHNCCPKNETFCEVRRKCLKNGEKCPLEQCEETECGKIFKHGHRCEMLEKICPLVVSAPATIPSAIQQYNNKTHKCSQPGEKFCYVNGECTNETCTLDKTKNEFLDKIPWGGNCSNGKAFCKSVMACITSTNKTCTFKKLDDWLQAGNNTVSPCGKVCNAGQKFCKWSYSCISSADNCTFSPPLAFNHTKNETATDFMCGPHYRFCKNQFRCVRKIEPCVDPKPLNFTGASDNGTGLLDLCRIKDIFCPRVTYAMLKCGATKEFAHCIKKDFPTCAQGFEFCGKSGKCIKSGDHCLGHGECLPYQYKCPELGGCINKTIACLIPQSQIIYKTAWFYEKLEEVKPTLFPTGSTIAILSMSESNGTFEYHDGSKWVSVDGITPTTALVVGKANIIRYVPGDHSFQGAVLFNYTVTSGTVGQKIDASSKSRGPSDVIVSIVLPRVNPPTLKEIGAQFQIYEDHKGEGFELEDKLEMIVQNVSTENNIPFAAMASMKRSTVKTYKTYLELIEKAKPAVAVLYLENSDKIGRFRGDQTKREKPIVLKDLKKKFIFDPALHYHGNFTASFSGVILYKDENKMLLDIEMPPVVSSIIFVIFHEKNATDNQMSEFQRVTKNIRSSKTRPTKVNVIDAITKAEKEASGQNKTDLGIIKQWVTLAYARASIVSGGVEPLPKYEALHITTQEGPRGLVYSDNVFTITSKVLKVNDAPELTAYVVYFPPIAYNVSVKPNNGFPVSEIISRVNYEYGKTPSKFSKIAPLIKDIDGDTPGFGIVFAKNTSIGSYYYRDNSGSAWKAIDLNNTLVNGKLKGSSEVLLLKPSAQLKFQMHEDTLWNNKDAKEKANLLLVAWDQSDNKSNGVHNFDFPVGSNASISKRIASAYTARMGCDGKPGSRGKVGACGKCGGDGTWCRGCDNIANSGAVLDHCGNCTGGTTGKSFNFRRDCGGGCGKSFLDSCGVCQKYGKIRNFADCTGACFGGAKINKCNYCVLGNTSKTLTHGQDLCGICGGSNNTCLDCAGTPKGGKKIDICGQCLLPSDSKFNAECIKLGKIDPISGENSTDTNIKVVGAGLQNYKTATCEFFNSGGTVKSVAAVPIKSKTFYVAAKGVAAGEYSLRCKFDSESTLYTAMNNFTFYDKATISFSGITPNETETNKGPVNVTITGSGFPNTGYIKCISSKKKFSVPATYVSATEVKCYFGNEKKSADMKVVPQFGAQDDSISPSAPTFQFYALSPYPTKVRFTENLQDLEVTMNKPSQHKTKLLEKTKSCSGIFDAGSITKFGSTAKCELRRPDTLFVLLNDGPTISPNDIIKFEHGALTRKFEDVTKFRTGTVNLTVEGPTKPVVPVAVLSAPDAIGVCTEVKLDASQSYGSGGRRLSFNWNVTWASDQNMGAVDAAGTADLAAIQTILAALPSFSPIVIFKNVTNFKFNLKYEFAVQVTNFLNQKSENSTVVVVRVNLKSPLIEAGSKDRSIKASRDFTIQAKAIPAPCLDPNDVTANVLFNWELRDAVGIDLGITNKPRLSIKKETLQAGKDYPLTVTATMASDQTLVSTKEITLKVESSPLVAIIEGGSYQVVGSTDTLALDGSKSRDPDGSSGTTWYIWECTDSNGDPCFVPDPENAGKKIRLVMATTAKFKLDVAKNLETKSTYTFTMTFNKDKRIATTSVTIKVEPGSPPKIVIFAQEKFKENPTTVTIVNVVAKSTMPKTDVNWMCVEEDGYGFVDLTEAAGTALSFSFTKLPSEKEVSKKFALSLDANSLADGVRYKLRLTVAHSDSTAIAETIITMNAAPKQGDLTVLPTNGTAMSTLYTLDATKGWSDDPDDRPLTYNFGYIKKGKAVPQGMYIGTPKLYDVKLPTGDANNNYELTVYVDCKDALGAITRQTTKITVMPTIVTPVFLNNAQDDVQKKFDSANWNSALGTMGALFDSIPPDANVTTMKEELGGSTMNILETGGIADDLSAKNSIYEPMAAITSPEMSDGTKTKFASTIVSVETGISSKRRRRRAVNDAPSVTAITVSQAETTLSILSNLIDPAKYDSTTMNLKTSFLPVVDSTGQKVCAGIALGMAASVVKDKLVVLRTEKNAFSNVDTAYTEIACKNCSSGLPSPSISAKVLLGKTLKDTYGSWNCSGGDNLCSGACLITSQQIYDLLSTSAADNETLTSVVDMKLYNPETYAAISVSTLAIPVTYHLPLLNVTFNNGSYFQCKRWSGSEWTNSGCTTTPTFVESNGTETKYVECKCTQLGYTAAFKTSSPPPTQPPTTAMPTTKAPVTDSTPAPVKVKVRRVRMALVGDYDTIAGTPAKAEQAKKDIAKSLASVMNINETRIVNMTLSKGSIVVVFALLPSNSDSEASIASTLSKLETAVKNDNFKVTLKDGTVLKADPVSFSSTSGDTNPTAPPATGAPTTEKSGLTQTEIIIIAVVCGAVVLIILIVIIVCCCKKKKSSHVKVSPENSRAQLREDVEMDERLKPDGNYNAAVQA